MSDWVPVSERLPQPCRSILVAHMLPGDSGPPCVSHGLLTKDREWYHVLHDWFADDEEPTIDGVVTHWMYAPEPPTTPKETTP